MYIYSQLLLRVSFSAATEVGDPSRVPTPVQQDTNNPLNGLMSLKDTADKNEFDSSACFGMILVWYQLLHILLESPSDQARTNALQLYLTLVARKSF